MDYDRRVANGCMLLDVHIHLRVCNDSFTSSFNGFSSHRNIVALHRNTYDGMLVCELS